MPVARGRALGVTHTRGTAVGRGWSVPRLGRLALGVCAVACCAVVSVGPAAASTRADAFVVNPGPIAAGRPIIGTGHNLPPITGGTYDAGALNIRAITDYYANQASADRAAVAQAALAWVEGWLQRKCPGRTPVQCRAVVVFDVDETLLGTLNYSLAQNPVNEFNPAAWDAYVRACGYTAIPETIALYDALRSKGVPIVLLGGGSSSLREPWTTCLERHGISGWRDFILRDSASAGLSVAQFKAGERAKLIAAGDRIVASVGDQVSDMSYGRLGRGFLLPNLLYYLG